MKVLLDWFDDGPHSVDIFLSGYQKDLESALSSTPYEGPQAMISSHTRNLVWQDYLDTARFVRNYGALARRYNFFRKCFHFVLLMPLFSATELVIDKFPNWVDAIVGLVIVVAVIVELIWKFTDKAIIARIVCTESIKLEREWSNL